MATGDALSLYAKTPSLTIGVMGYYGFGNLGDDMLLKAIRRFLAPHRVIAFPAAFAPTVDALERLNAFDYLVLGGGGLFNRTPAAPFDTFDRWASQLQVPISVLGLGVEQLDAKFTPAIHLLVERSDFFIVRDTESKRLIGHSKVQVAPDLTFYQPLPWTQDPTDRHEVRCGVNLRPLHQGVAAWIAAISALPCKKHPLPFSLVPTYDDREPLEQLTGTWPQQASLDAYRQLDVVIGTAFHALVFAIQAGIPAIAINYHPKVRRLMEEVGLTDYVLEWQEPQRLRSCFEKALTERDSIRERMAAYTNSAQRTLAAVLAEVRSEIEARVPARDDEPILVGANKRVTALVLCESADRTNIIRTLDSLRAQTHPQLDIVLVGCPADTDALMASANADGATHREISFIPNDQDVVERLSLAGDYVTWVTAGTWLAEDALALLVKTLEKQPGADLAQSDYFLTHDGNIDRKISLRPLASVRTLPLGPSFLARRALAGDLWRAQIRHGKQTLSSPESGIHLTQPLLYRPATPGERSIHLAAIAFGRGQTETAQILMSQSIEEDPDMARHPAVFEQAFRVFLDAAYDRLIATDPLAYLATTCTVLPLATRAQRRFARLFAGRANLELAYMHNDQGRKSQTRNCLLRAFWYDPRLLSNRGAVRLLVEATIWGSVVRSSQQAEKPQSVHP